MNALGLLVLKLGVFIVTHNWLTFGYLMPYFKWDYNYI